MKLLIVEDNQLWAELAHQYCSQIGAESQTVSTSQEALDELDREEYDGIILDLLLAGETGVALLNELISHEDLANIPVVVWTNVAEATDDVFDKFGVKSVIDKATATPTEIRQALAGAFK